MPYTIEQTLSRAEQCFEAFRQRIGEVEPARRGVQVSEIFFIYATVGDYRPRQIVESGRARGQSTCLLARCFPQVPIISVEYHADHPDVPLAARRLVGLTNVACLFGDATRLLPELAIPGDVVVIDGPKGFRSLVLALEILRRGRAELVFIHDCPRGGRLRSVVERYAPWAFFSDDPRFAERYRQLDVPAKGEENYGIFACIPARPGFPSRADCLRLDCGRWLARLRRSLRKRLR